MASTQSIGSSASTLSTAGSGRIQRFIGRNDTDGNGTLSLSEFEQIRQNLPGGSASSSLSAGSAATSASGAAGASTSAADLFKQIDTDGDGQLSASELGTYRQTQISAARSALLNLQEVFGSGEGGRAGHGSHGVGHHHRSSTDADAASTDATSAAGSATGASGSALDSLFSQLDTDGSGSVSRSELSTFLVQAMNAVPGTSATSSSTAAATATAKTATA